MEGASPAPPLYASPSAMEEDSVKRNSKPLLQPLDIARDIHGRSPLPPLLRQSSLATPRGISNSTSNPAVLDLEKIVMQAMTPRISRKPDDGDPDKAWNDQMQLSQLAARKEVLSASPGDLWPIKNGTSVACEGSSPTALTALRSYYPESFAIQYLQSDGVLGALESGRADRALLAVENSLEGTRHRTYDLLLRHKFHIVGELVQVHDHALESAKQEITSRFWVLARDAILPKPDSSASATNDGGDSVFKTTVALVLPDGLGSLHKIMAAFLFRGIHVTKVESRPWRHQPLIKIDPASNFQFQYVVFIDFQGSTATHKAQNALSQLQQHSCFLRVLGSYPTMTQSAPFSFNSDHITPLASPRPVFSRS